MSFHPKKVFPNPKKRAALIKRARTMTAGMTLEHWESWKNDQTGTPLVEMKNPQGIQITDPSLLKMLQSFVRNWRVEIKVRCLTDAGEVYIEERDVIAKGAKLNDLTDIFIQQKADALAAVNPGHIVDVGWTAKALT